MLIITLAARKGGVGKTTLAASFAVAAHPVGRGGDGEQSHRRTHRP
jgi:MinD-like ATPase involved in chromosome partitioning or flagellar assembly